jgi:hypothetical protein
MRGSRDDIERQANEMSDDIEQDFGSLEQPPALDARPFGRIAVIGVAVLALAGAGYFVYRRVKRPTLAKRLRTRVIDSLRDLPPELKSRLKNRSQGSGGLGARAVF